MRNSEESFFALDRHVWKSDKLERRLEKAWEAKEFRSNCKTAPYVCVEYVIQQCSMYIQYNCIRLFSFVKSFPSFLRRRRKVSP